MKLRKREKIALILVTATVLTTGFPALKGQKEARIESYDFPSNWLDQRDSVVALITTDKLRKDRDAEIYTTRGEALGKNQSEKFSGQISVVSCSGILVSNEILITATRCLDSTSKGLDNLRAVRTFQYYSKNEAHAPKFRPSILGSEISGLDKIIHHDKLGYSIVKLKKPFDYSRPLTLKREFPSNESELQVASIGHPMGLAKKGDWNITLASESTYSEGMIALPQIRGFSLGEPFFDLGTQSVIGIRISDSSAVSSSAIIDRLTELGIPLNSL